MLSCNKYMHFFSFLFQPFYVFRISENTIFAKVNTECTEQNVNKRAFVPRFLKQKNLFRVLHFDFTCKKIDRSN